jgi:hypothetical protein
MRSEFALFIVALGISATAEASSFSNLDFELAKIDQTDLAPDEAHAGPAFTVWTLLLNKTATGSCAQTRLFSDRIHVSER